MMNAISNYLQQLPLSSHSTTENQQTQAAGNSAGAEATPNSTDGYSPSNRVYMVGAVASDYNVRQLSSEELSGLQRQVQEYGLLQGRDLDAFAVLNTAAQESQAEQEGQEAAAEQTQKSIDAVGALEVMVRNFDDLSTPYSVRQQITRLQRLLYNLDSAHQVIRGQG